MKHINPKKAHFSFCVSFILALSFILFFILPLVTCPLWGQVVQKKQLNISDYPLLGELQFDKVSPNENWASFTMVYQNNIDTLFVQNTSNKKKYCYFSASNSQFLDNNRFVCQTSKGLELLDLDTSKQETIPSVIQYAYVPNQKQLVVLTAEKQLLLIDKDNKIIHKLEQVEKFIVSPCGEKLLYISNENLNTSIGILELGKQNRTRWLIEKSQADFTMPTWEKKGRSLAFLSTHISSGTNQNLLFYYILDSNFLYRLNPEKQIGFPADKTIDNQGGYAISISEDLSRVFLGIRPIENLMKKKTDSIPVELWNGNAKWVYPREHIMGQFSKRPNMAVWLPFTGHFFPISSAELPKVMLAGKEQFALLSNPQSYEPQFNYDGPRDFYIMDLNTQKKQLLLQKQIVSPMEGIPLSSPGGKYITYYKENNWWVYNLESKTHSNITGKINVPFTGKVYELYNTSPYGNIGFTPNDKEVVLYDQYDLWVVSPDGNHFRRITHGREKQIQFRIAQSSLCESFTANYDGWTSNTINLSAGILLEAKGNDGKTGYFKWKEKTGEIAIIYKSAYVSKLKALDRQDSYIYQEEQFDRSPKLMFRKGKIATVFFQSNPKQAQYNWGASELISYLNSKGEKLQALLYYPALYDPEKKYPMIVHVYEKQSQNLYKYKSPSLDSEDGYNPTVLTNEGYFVLCPDIVHEPGEEGPSSVDCTVSATREIISKGLVDSSKIGLMGHSFGGYETAFIITHTDLFAAAAAGSAITDINSYYLSVNWDSGRTTMNYFQNEQFKMGKSLWEIPEVFARNSPIVFADKITTPLLSFTGKQDNHVDWHQSIEFYLALRRLNKKHIMLIYPDEAHSLIDPANQRDLSKRVLQWFGYYLKNEIPKSWISDGIQ